MVPGRPAPGTAHLPSNPHYSTQDCHHCAQLFHIVLYYTVVQCTVLYCTVLYTVLYCTVLHCTVLYFQQCTVLKCVTRVLSGGVIGTLSCQHQSLYHHLTTPHLLSNSSPILFTSLLLLLLLSPPSHLPLPLLGLPIISGAHMQIVAICIN